MSDKETKILLIEDDAQTRRMVSLALSHAGYRVLEADGVEVGLHLFKTQQPSLLVLDINLPDGNGLEVCKKIRAHKSLFATPIIMLTGRSKLEEKAVGFEAGADQYLAKPVSPEELLLWVKALLRRLSYDKQEGDELKAGDLVIDLAAHTVRFKDQVLPYLTGKEFDLLYYLVKNRPKVLGRQQILTELWKTITVERVVDVHLSHLRQKLPPEVADKIQTVPGKGFRFFLET